MNRRLGLTSSCCLIGLALFFQGLDVLADPLTSPSGKFKVTGMDSPANAVLADWAEDILTRVESTVGMEVPFDDVPIRLIAVRDANRPVNAVPTEGWLDGFYQQKLFLVNPGQIDQERVLEGLTWLILNRIPASSQTARQRKNKLARFPPWLAVGISQHLYSSVRARNCDAAELSLAAGVLPDIKEILEWTDLGDVRSFRRGLCGVLAGWICNKLDKGNGWGPVIKELVSGKPINAEWFSKHIAPIDDPATTAEWHGWIVNQASIIRSTASLPPSEVYVFDELLREFLCPFVPRQGDGRDCLDDLPGISSDHPEWEKAVSSLLPALHSHALGRPPDFNNVARQYIKFVNLLANPKSETRKVRAKTLADARAAAEALATKLQYAGEFLDAYQARREARSLEPVGRKGIDWRMASEWRAEKYLDSLEQMAAEESITAPE